MLQINKLLFILALSQFMFACDDITPEPLISSPDRELIDSVLVSAQVATGETVNYTFDINTVPDNTIYEINVKRAGGANPDVVLCEFLGCSSSVGFNYPLTYDGTIIWHTTVTTATLFTTVGGGDEAQYSITARAAPTNVENTSLTDTNTYGVVNLAETAKYSFAVTSGQGYTFTAEVDLPTTGAVNLSACENDDPDCTTKVTPLASYTATFTGTLYVFVDNNDTTDKTLFHIKATSP